MKKCMKYGEYKILLESVAHYKYHLQNKLKHKEDKTTREKYITVNRLQRNLSREFIFEKTKK